MVSVVMFTILLVLVAADILYHQSNPYNSLVTYLLLPGVLVGGVGLIFLGAGLEWRRRHNSAPGVYPTLPVIDFNSRWMRRRLVVAATFTAVFVAFSSVGTYRAYHFTESPEFCGLVCHQVMKPEYTAYQHSAHARVSCAECHIGDGAEWYVKAKMSGLRQVWAVAMGTYNMPIETPVHNLRPAADTCEQCHWPDKFLGSAVKEIWHFAADQTNTPIRYDLLMKVGGGGTEMSHGKGIHWHVNPDVKVRYWASDRQRNNIPWVEVTKGDGEPQVFRTADAADLAPPEAEIRTMDCMDCHNRPSHVYRSPRQMIDHAMAQGQLVPSLPFLKRYATELLQRDYPDTPTALANIAESLRNRYADRMRGPRGSEMVEKSIEWLQTLYQENIFPEQKVNWRVYPNHLGHFEFPGCYRCHDDKHELADQSAKITNDCQLCHDFLDQAEGEAAFEPPTYGRREFVHPRNLGDIWKNRNCTDCHGVDVEGVAQRNAP